MTDRDRFPAKAQTSIRLPAHHKRAGQELAEFRGLTLSALLEELLARELEENRARALTRHPEQPGEFRVRRVPARACLHPIHMREDDEQGRPCCLTCGATV